MDIVSHIDLLRACCRLAHIVKRSDTTSVHIRKKIFFQHFHQQRFYVTSKFKTAYQIFSTLKMYYSTFFNFNKVVNTQISKYISANLTGYMKL